MSKDSAPGDGGGICKGLLVNIFINFSTYSLGLGLPTHIFSGFIFCGLVVWFYSLNCSAHLSNFSLHSSYVLAVIVVMGLYGITTI